MPPADDGVHRRCPREAALVDPAVGLVMAPRILGRNRLRCGGVVAGCGPTSTAGNRLLLKLLATQIQYSCTV